MLPNHYTRPSPTAVVDRVLFFIIEGTNNIKEAIELYLSIITESPQLKEREKLGFLPQPNLRLL
jgi:hypothetical protein